MNILEGTLGPSETHDQINSNNIGEKVATQNTLSNSP